ncbi:MAG: Gx transporter family protein [Oscillospiraceae bacterium]|nr:Gx transporter family protein [Oscillospiraceae bacterium]
MRFSTKQLALCAVLASLALALSYMEGMFPPPVPLPGVKLGLANIVSLFALCTLGAPYAFAVLLVRVLLGSLFAGNASALIFSLFGGLAAMGVMCLLRRCKRLSVYGISIGGAAAHNSAQIAAAMLTLGSSAPLAYLPALLLVSLFTGALTGLIAALLLRAVPHSLYS